MNAELKQLWQEYNDARFKLVAEVNKQFPIGSVVQVEDHPSYIPFSGKVFSTTHHADVVEVVFHATDRIVPISIVYLTKAPKS